MEEDKEIETYRSRIMEGERFKTDTASVLEIVVNGD